MTRLVRAARVLFGLTMLLPAAAVAQDVEADVRIDWAAFKKAYDARQLVVVDVRGRDAWEEGHIPGAALTMQQHGIDAKALLGGLAKWFEETGKLEKGRRSPGP